MAEQLKKIRSRIQSIQSTQQITRAMKMASTNKLKKAQNAVTQFSPYVDKSTHILQTLTTNNPGIKSPFLESNENVKSILLIVISSDKGLCGRYNANIFKQVIKHIESAYAKQHQNRKVQIVPIGKKAFEFFQKKGYPLSDTYKDLFHNCSYTEVNACANAIIRLFQEKQFQKIEIIYNKFISIAQQKPSIRAFLPLEKKQEESVPTPQKIVDFLYEPNPKTIVEKYVPQVLKSLLYESLLSAQAAEHAARIVAMEQATENAGTLLHQLKIAYNRARQSTITKELIEVISGAAGTQ